MDIKETEITLGDIIPHAKDALIAPIMGAMT
jgi:hypothetical protein